MNSNLALLLFIAFLVFAIIADNLQPSRRRGILAIVCIALTFMVGIRNMYSWGDTSIYVMWIQPSDFANEMASSYIKENSERAFANDSKTLAIVSRAFIFGRTFFSNNEFKKEFHDYAALIKQSNMIWYEKWPIYFSCKDNYHFWNSLYHRGLNLKQVAKKLHY